MKMIKNNEVELNSTPSERSGLLKHTAIFFLFSAMLFWMVSCENPVSKSNAVTSLNLDLTSMNLEVGGPAGLLTATVLPANAANLIWTSQNSAVATVSAGLVTPISEGTTIITVATADGSKTALCAVMVSAAAIPVYSVSLNLTSMNLVAGGSTGSLYATINPYNASNPDLTWSSDASGVATVNAGVVTPVSAGTAMITVTTTDGSKTATCNVTVSAAAIAVSSVSLSATVMNLVAGGSTGSLTATIAPSTATNKNLAWSSNNIGVATVNAGVVTPITVGTATITVTTADGSKTATCALTVGAASIPVSSVSLSATSMSLVAGGSTGSLSATIAPSTATNKNLAWSSNNTAVATVSAGVVTPLSAGTATITATTTDGGKTATCAVTVAAASIPVSSVSLSATSMNLVAGGSTGSLTATIAPSTATNKNLAWSSNNTGVATVNAGVVTPVTPGSAIITVTTNDGSKTATCSVTVAAVPVSSVGLNVSVLSLTAGGANGSLSATIAPSNATNKALAWSSNNTAVATVNAGMVTPLSAGTATITVTTADGSKTATCSVTVAAAPIPVSSVSLNVTTLSLLVGGPAGTLAATISPSTATNKTVTWSSNNTAVATVSAGVVTPLSAGTATITATSADGGKTATCSVTVAYQVGQTGPAGGIIFYDKGSYSNGWRYLETSTSEVSMSCAWGTQEFVDALGTAVGTGKANTAAIIAFYGTAGTYAAQLCDSLVQGGFSDWFLPSDSELWQMLKYFADNVPSSPTYYRNYWSSTANGYDHALYNGGSTLTATGNDYKTVLHCARAIRSF